MKNDLNAKVAAIRRVKPVSCIDERAFRVRATMWDAIKSLEAQRIPGNLIQFQAVEVLLGYVAEGLNCGRHEALEWMRAQLEVMK